MSTAHRPEPPPPLPPANWINSRNSPSCRGHGGLRDGPREFHPHDATTNPSLILQAATKLGIRPNPRQGIARSEGSGLTGREASRGRNRPCARGVRPGNSPVSPGRVSTETDARLSFDTQGTIQKGASLDRALSGGRHRARSGAHQDRLDVEAIRAAGSAGKGRYPAHLTVSRRRPSRGQRRSLSPHSWAAFTTGIRPRRSATSPGTA